MFHAVVGMVRVKHPSKGLGEVITGVENAQEMLHDQVTLFVPFLNGEVLDLSAPSTWHGPVFVDHVQCSNIVNQQASGTRMKGVKFKKDAMETLDNFAGVHGQMEFCLSQTGGNDGLNPTFPCNGGTAEEYC